MPAKKQLQPYQLDPRRVKRVQRFIGCATEEETLDKVLDIMIGHQRSDREYGKLTGQKIPVHESFRRVSNGVLNGARRKTTPSLKTYLLDARKVQRVQKYLQCAMPEEAIDNGLQVLLDDQMIERTLRELVEGGGDIEDIYGRLAHVSESHPG